MRIIPIIRHCDIFGTFVPHITLQQIPAKLSGKPITKVGINFDSTQGNITDWVIEA